MEAKARANAADFTVPDGECFLDSIPQREYPRGMFTLLFQNSDGIPREHPLNGERTTICRSAECTVVLDDGSVSAHHAEIRCQDGPCILRDNGSSNGTDVNPPFQSWPPMQNPRRILMRFFFGFFAVCFCLCSCDEKERAKAFNENQLRMAEQGNVNDQVAVGFNYTFGHGVAKDGAEAVKWFRRAAEQGDASAQHMLGSSYEFGRGVPKDDAEAVKWYRMAAEQGNGGGQHGLASMYFLGRGVVRDNAINYKWALLAAGQENDANAKAQLQVMIESIEKIMTPEQRTEGQRMAREFKATKQTR